MDNPSTDHRPRRWKFPEATRFDKIVAKDKILRQTPASPAEKKLFRQQIRKIRCSHEITADSMNIDSSFQVPKILVIQLTSIVPEPEVKVLSTVDRAFGVPVIFEIHHKDQSRYAASCRRRTKADKGSWTFSPYFWGPWMDKNIETFPAPLALSLDILYEKLLTRLLPLQQREQEDFVGLMERWENIQILNREMTRLEARIQREKQFNRKVALNRSLNQLKKQMEKSC